MKIADLFIAIGIEGANQVKSTLGDTRKGLNETTSSALWAKAAIIGVLYGLEQLVSTSNAAGAGLQQFAGYSGLSAESLQRYAFAGQQASVAAEQTQSSILGLQKAMAQLETTGQGPAGLWVVGREVGLDRTKIRDTLYLFGKLQEFAQKSKLPVGIANQALESFGLSPAVINAMRRNAYNPKNFAGASVYSDKETAGLARMNAQWANLGTRISYAIGRLNVKHGGELIRDISMIADKVLILTDRLITLADKAAVFKYIGKAFEGWAMILDSVNKNLDPKKKEEKPGFLYRALFDTEALARDSHAGKDLGAGGAKDDFKNWMYLLGESINSAKNEGAGGATVQQTQIFHGPTDPDKAGAAARAGAEKGVSDAVRQSQALRRVH